MPENEEVQEVTEDQLDAELEAEAAKFQEEPEEPEVEAVEVAEAEKPEEKEQKPLTDEDGDKIARDYLEKRGFKVVLPGEVEAEKAGAEQDAKSQTVEEVLKSLPEVELDPAVLEAIEAKHPGPENQAKRDALFVQYAAKQVMESVATEKAKEMVAPIAQERQMAMWEAKARATANDIVTKAETPEALEAVTKIISEAGPDSEERYKTDPQFKAGIDARIKLAVIEIQDSLADQEQKELPTAEHVGGQKPSGSVAADSLTGEAKAMAAEYKKDLAEGLITKQEYDGFMKDLHKEATKR